MVSPAPNSNTRKVRMTIDLAQVAAFAKDIHRGQTRKYFDPPRPYTEHLGRTSGRALIMFGTTAAAAMLLHDSVEDHPERIDWNLIAALFGNEVADLVLSLTSYSKQTHYVGSRDARKKMDRAYLARQSQLVKCLKMIDRIDNMTDLLRTMRMAKSADFAAMYAQETRELIKAIWMVGGEYHKEYELLLGELEQTIEAVEIGHVRS